MQYGDENNNKDISKVLEIIALFMSNIKKEISSIKKILDKDEKKANTIEDDQNKE